MSGLVLLLSSFATWMFKPPKYPSTSSGQGAYSRLQQQDDLDDEDYDTLKESLSHHPNSIIVRTPDNPLTVLPLFPLLSPLTVSPSSPPLSPRLTAKNAAATIPNATRRFLKTKLPNVAFRKSMKHTVSLDSLPNVIIADIQHDNIPHQADPLLKELPTRGWTIVHRRPYSKSQPDSPVACSVFVKWEPKEMMTPMMAIMEPLRPNDPIPVSQEEFASLVESVRIAIDGGIQPTRISQGSSGSYFSHNKQGKIVGVFKPKNEEPYGQLNPKWTKWIHRHLFPCFFGRSCLIPNLGYLSEAAASLMDRRLGTFIVPTTDVVHLASPAFHYDYLDRRSSTRPPKIGSFQCFLHGYKDATLFLKDHPLNPDPSPSYGRSSSVWAGCLGQQVQDEEEEELGGEERLHEEEEDLEAGKKQQDSTRFKWTNRLQEQFKREFEQLVILDYLIRNTDRGLDNWMIKYCPNPPHLHVAAIDNGLAFPFKHPDQWRSYPYGWLALPDYLVSRPFSLATRRQFLPLLTDPAWWCETIKELRAMFMLDSDFDERMFANQMAVLKGQGYNIVRALKDPSGSPLDLVALERIVIPMDEILIEYDETILDKRQAQQSTTTAVESPSTSVLSEPVKTKRIRPKRSTSFDINLHREATEEEPWKERVRNRMSLDLGRRRAFRKARSRAFGSDGEGDSEDDSEDERTRTQATLVMENIEIVKSRTYFTCC
ncbi:phosphatidylinositol 3 and 4-kinase-domain-containing protein [Phycomyces nitens]|nr:phosphatidylinositol 3 and 4-kinase-domain-containing protein [Phycomyces nitens]